MVRSELAERVRTNMPKKRAKHHLPFLFNIIINQWESIPIIIPLNYYRETYLLDDYRIFDLGGN